MKTLYVKLTFDDSACEDVSPEEYDADVDFENICEYGSEYYNLLNWEIVTKEVAESESE